MAIACLRLVTFFPELPLRSVPAFRSRMAFSTLSWLALLYFRAICQSPLMPARTTNIGHWAELGHRDLS